MWNVLRAKNLTDDRKKCKQRIVEKVLFKHKLTMVILFFYQAVLPLLNAPLLHKLHDRQLFRDCLAS